MSLSVQPLTSSQEAGRWLRSVLVEDARLCADSRTIRAGDGFVAYPGLTSDGRRYIAQACSRGAGAVLLDADALDQIDMTRLTVPGASLSDLSRCAGSVSSVFYQKPSAGMTVFAVTGTNGKTSCAHWIAAGLAGNKRASAAIGTLGISCFGGESPSAGQPLLPDDDTTLTTPDAVAMQDAFSRLKSMRVDTVALEASSIGLDQNRLAGTAIDIAVFTNLSRDHLDYHADMNSYFQAKQQLFRWPELKAAVINTDDPQAAKVIDACKSHVRCYGYGTDRARLGSFEPRLTGFLHISDFRIQAAGMQIQMHSGQSQFEAVVPMLGRFNALNLAAVCLAWHASGLSMADSTARLEHLQPVPGRMQTIAVSGQPLLVIDYAHTPDALAAALSALRPVVTARGNATLWVVFGCGGDRDPGKRAMMGEVASELADRVILTSDNPRTESPEVIIDNIKDGIAGKPWLSEPDRTAAIRAAIESAGANDVVLIAGKGHEDYQEVNGQRTSFSDAVVCADLLRTARAKG